MKLNLLADTKVRVNRKIASNLALSAFVMLNIPILYIGTGEGIGDVAPFDVRTFVEEMSS